MISWIVSSRADRFPEDGAAVFTRERRECSSRRLDRIFITAAAASFSKHCDLPRHQSIPHIHHRYLLAHFQNILHQNLETDTEGVKGDTPPVCAMQHQREEGKRGDLSIHGLEARLWLEREEVRHDRVEAREEHGESSGEVMEAEARGITCFFLGMDGKL
jgi:hypothetical protein